MIVRDGKGEDLLVKLFLAPYNSQKFDKSSYGDVHTVRVLPVGDVKCGGTALDPAGEEGKVHSRGGYEVGEGLDPISPTKGSSFLSFSSVNAGPLNPTE